MKIAEILADSIKQLKEAGIATSQLDAILLISSVFKLSKEAILLSGDQIKAEENLIPVYLNLISRRKKFEPISHLIGFREFYGRKFKVNQDVLDPRPDSETLIETVLSDFFGDLIQNQNRFFLEIGAGSGCLSISLLLEKQNWQALALDKSEKALEICEQNLNSYQLQNRLKLQLIDLFAKNFVQEIGQKFSFLISNPPYIPNSIIPALQPEVALYEPRIALDGGVDGLDFYRRIAVLAKDLIEENGKIFLEIGENQEQEVVKIFAENGYELIRQSRDLSGKIRVLTFNNC